jgi:hypothetical protein
VYHLKFNFITDDGKIKFFFYFLWKFDLTLFSFLFY